MIALRLMVTCVLLALTTTACGGISPPRIRDCATVLVEYQELPDRKVLSISAHACGPQMVDDPTGVSARAGPGLMPADAALDRLAEIVWHSTYPRFDSIYATVYLTGDDPPLRVIPHREYGREELQARWGPRPAELDIAKPVEFNERYLFPLAILFRLALFIGLVQAIRNGRVITIWVHQR